MLPTIEDLVPHRGRMLLIDRVLSYAGDSVVCELVVRDDPLFCEDGKVGSWVGIEYMAQSVAALVGLKAHACGQAVRIGLLLGTRKFSANRPFMHAGDRIRVEAVQVYMGDNGLGAFEARLLHEDFLLAEATLSAFQPDDVNVFLKGLNG